MPPPQLAIFGSESEEIEESYESSARRSLKFAVKALRIDSLLHKMPILNQLTITPHNHAGTDSNAKSCKAMTAFSRSDSATTNEMLHSDDPWAIAITLM